MRIAVLVLIAVTATFGQTTGSLPRLEKQGTATRLIVDGAPFLILGGELHNSSASSLEYMRPVWPKLKALNLNTVLATVSWELLEPEEGKFDFTLVDGLIKEARAHGLRLVFLWFGSWKNGVSTYPPGWVKTDAARFPRVRDRAGRTMDVLSPLSDASRDADARAFRALMKHIREIDARDRTVVMVQVENEVGLLGESRDRSPAAESAWAKPVPAALLKYLENHKTGSWPEVFGSGPDADEIFMAWHYGRYIGKVIAEGKAEYPLPMYVNAWLVQHEGQAPGDYPSGGPVSRVLEIWRAAAPEVDLLAPDIYLPDFKAVCASYTRSGNPLFIPEAVRSPITAANAFYAFGQHDAIGFSPFAIDSIEGEHPLAKSYELLSEIAPVISAHSGKGEMIGLLETNAAEESASLGGYKLTVSYPGAKRSADEKGFGIVISTGRDEFLVAGSGLAIAFSTARIAWVDEGRFVAGKWVAGRRLNGDETRGGTHLVLPEGKWSIQKIKLYQIR